VAQTGEVYTSSNLLTDPLVHILPGEDRQISQWRSSISLPLCTEDTVVGVMHIGTPEKREFSPEEIRLLTAIADMGAIAIHRADLHDRTKSQVQRLNALHTIDQAISSSVDMSLTLKVVLNQVTSVLHADAADVLLHRPKSRMLELEAAKGFRDPKFSRPQERLGEGLAGRVALERKITQIEDLRSSEDVPPGIVEREGFNSYIGVPLVAKGQIKGVLEIFHRSPLRPSSDWMDFLDQLADQTAVAIDNAQLFTDLQHSTIQLEMAYNTTLEGWALALELRDQETEGHSKRVTDLSVRVAEAMGISGEELMHIRRGALLHDIGKMGVPDHILLKPSELDEEEWEIMRQHPVMAYRLLSHIPFLRPALDIPHFHHERWDGSGYPMGLRGEAIPLAARIFAVVDVWDALRSDRPYRKAWTDEQAVTYLREQAGVLFDPKVVEVFLSLIGK
jgi:putative nucleotidyltransferase with HDIG domain